MADIIDFEAAQPHETGMARCGACGREWVAVAPVHRSVGGLECPSCHVMAGDYLVEGHDHGEYADGCRATDLRSALSAANAARDQAIKERDEARAVGPWEDMAMRNEALMAANSILTAKLDAARKALEDARVFVHDVATSYDHDEDAHRYNTPCRECGAKASEILLTAALTEMKGDE